jgi:RNA ligase (TIGR02306 family)
MKLATVEIIKELLPIDGADRIELCKVNGWHSVVLKDTFRVGDRVVFIPIDTIIDPAPWNSAFHDKDNPSAAIRVKTKKLRGVISSGLIFHTNIIPDPFYQPEIGEDVSGLIGGISKYIKSIPIQLQGIAKGDFPTHIVSKTDEDNLLSNPQVLEELKECDTITVTLKADGTSGTFIKELDGTFRVCSRNLELEDGDNIYRQMAKKYDLQNLMGDGMVFGGEIIGQGVQSNPLKIEGNEFHIFNIKDLNDNSYLSYDDMVLTLEGSGLNVVKEVKRLEGEDVKNISLNYFQNLANEQKYGTDPAEGIVIRGYKNNQTVYSPTLQKMLSVKVINQNYVD